MTKIAFDLDDTLGDHTQQFLAFYERVYRKKINYDSFTSYGLDRVLRLKPEEAYKRLSQFYESPEFDAISPLPRSQEFVQKLFEDGEQLFVLTGRPKALREKTKAWIRKYFPQIGLKQVLIVGELLPGSEPLKGPICYKRGIELIVEDSLEQALSCSTQTGVALLNRPWNQNSSLTLPSKPIQFLTKAITRVNSWEQVYVLSKKY